MLGLPFAPELELELKFPPHPWSTVTCSQPEDPAAVIFASSCGGNKNCSV